MSRVDRRFEFERPWMSESELRAAAGWDFAGEPLAIASERAALGHPASEGDSLAAARAYQVFSRISEIIDPIPAHSGRSNRI
jgi:hypothetical protein